MKKKLLILLAVAALIATVIAAPAGAFGRRSLRGHQDLDFNTGVVFGAGAAPNVAYVGSLEFRGGSYDIVYFPAAPLKVHGDWVYFQEIVRIYEADSVDAEFGEIVIPPEDPGGVPIVITGITEFAEGKLVVELTDKGWGSPWGTAFARGKVTIAPPNADPGGVLSGVKVGDRVFWHGRYLDDTHTTFAGPYRIFTRG